MAEFLIGQEIVVRVGFGGPWISGKVVHVTDRHVDVVVVDGRRFSVKVTSGNVRSAPTQPPVEP